jgi:dTDP-4-amino-4,6-dideoxygalactose transaminase
MKLLQHPLHLYLQITAILYNNLHPVFADVDDQLCLDPKSVEALYY